MNKNLSTTARYSVRIVSPRGKVEERGTRCTNQNTGHRVARDIARDSVWAKIRRVELVDPSGEVVERFTILKGEKGASSEELRGYNQLEVLNAPSVQAALRMSRAA